MNVARPIHLLRSLRKMRICLFRATMNLTEQQFREEER